MSTTKPAWLTDMRVLKADPDVGVTSKPVLSPIMGALPIKAPSHQPMGALPIKAPRHQPMGALPITHRHQTMGALPIKAPTHQTMGALPIKPQKTGISRYQMQPYGCYHKLLSYTGQTIDRTPATHAKTSTLTQTEQICTTTQTNCTQTSVSYFVYSINKNMMRNTYSTVRPYCFQRTVPRGLPINTRQIMDKTLNKIPNANEKVLRHAAGGSNNIPFPLTLFQAEGPKGALFIPICENAFSPVALSTNTKRINNNINTRWSHPLQGHSKLSKVLSKIITILIV
ncbi:MAG: hypothetical protein ACK5PF_01380, partial [bacterium]